ncbi:MAG: PadR family transcriptional regulator [Candidatus Korarchaeota archaeon]
MHIKCGCGWGHGSHFRGPLWRHIPIPLRVLEVLILKMLSEAPMHGYEIKKKLDEIAGGFWDVSFSRIYPLLRRMLHHGLIKREVSERGKKTLFTYSLTEKGKEILEEMLGEIDEAILLLTEKSKKSPFAVLKLVPLLSPLGLAVIKMLPDETQKEVLQTLKNALTNLLKVIEEHLKETEKA